MEKGYIGMRTAHAFPWLIAVVLTMSAPILAYSSGSGTEADLYPISIIADWNKEFILTADIAFGGIETEQTFSRERATSPDHV
jgi:hypothetical protein